MAKNDDDEDVLGPGSGHNVAGSELLSYIERYEKLDLDAAAINDDKKELRAEAKGRGWDTKQMMRVIAYRKRNADDVAEEESIFELYLSSIGMLPDD
jgi:uncharacterized protein (UPF0335 family)